MTVEVGVDWLVYAAGLIDGGGCIMIGKRQRVGHRHPTYIPQVVVNMVKRDCIDKMQYLFGGCINRKKHSNPNANYSWAWTLTGTPALKFLSQIEPYVILKEPQVAAALWVLNSARKDPNGKKLTPDILANRERCRELCHLHNKRGRNA